MMTAIILCTRHLRIFINYRRYGKAKQAYLQAIKLDDKQGDVYNNFGAFLCGKVSLNKLITI